MATVGFSLLCRLILLVTLTISVIEGPYHVTGSPQPEGETENKEASPAPAAETPPLQSNDAAPPASNNGDALPPSAAASGPGVNGGANSEAGKPQAQGGSTASEKQFAKIAVGEAAGTKDSNTTYYTHSTHEKFESKWGSLEGPPQGQGPPPQEQKPASVNPGSPNFNFGAGFPGGQNPFQFMFG